MIDFATPPLLFLDIDGVVNRRGCFDEIAMSSTFHPECVAILNSVFERVPSIKVVISSSWRYMLRRSPQTHGAGAWFGGCDLRGFEYLLRTHRLHVVDRIIGHTPFDEEVAHRGDQIRAFLAGGDWFRWAAVDDEDSASMRALGERLVLTDGRIGITQADADRLVALLSGAP